MQVPLQSHGDRVELKLKIEARQTLRLAEERTCSSRICDPDTAESVPNWHCAEGLGTGIRHLAVHPNHARLAASREKQAICTHEIRVSGFGEAGALSQGMMPNLTEITEHGHRPHCTREQARDLLQALRAEYQSMSPADRSLIKGILWQQQRDQYGYENS